MRLSRRTAMASGLAAGALATGSARAQTPWPSEFLWGTATAAHQIEGNNVNSDYWVLETLPATNFVERSGDTCDSWNRWREDVAIIQALGLTAYRFSIEWARVEPEDGMISHAALDHYRQMCVACREAGIEPIVTLHHFSSPRWFAALGGWEAEEAPAKFARYCGIVAAALGEHLTWVCTMNEPNAQVTSYVMRDDRPFPNEDEVIRQATKAVGSDRWGAYFMGNSFAVRDGCLAAHALATEAIKTAAPHVKTGLTLALQDLKPGPGGEARYRRIFDNARAPFYAAASGDDFIGVQPYMRLIVGRDGYLPTPPGVIVNHSGRDASPDALTAVVREVRANCRAPVMITENGIETDDDALRVRHINETLEQIQICLTEAPLLGYIHWSLLDNFEWRSGYGPRFGLYSVDRRTFVRTPKPAAGAYRAIVARARANSA